MRSINSAPIIIGEYAVTQVGDLFRAQSNSVVILFKAEYKNGMYSKVERYVDVNKDRIYQAQRYTLKYVAIVRELAFSLLKADILWNYERQEPALKSYNRDLEKFNNRGNA